MIQSRPVRSTWRVPTPERAAAIEDGLEAAVTIGEQASLETRRRADHPQPPQSKAGTPPAASQGVEALRTGHRPGSHQSRAASGRRGRGPGTGQSARYHHVCPRTAETRRRSATRKRRRNASPGPRVQRPRAPELGKPIESGHRAHPPCAPAIAKHGVVAIVWKPLRYVEPGRHEAAAIEGVDRVMGARNGDDSSILVLDERWDVVVAKPVGLEVAHQAEDRDSHRAAGVRSYSDIAVAVFGYGVDSGRRQGHGPC